MAELPESCKLCSVCGERGHNARRHEDISPDKCGYCGRHGHKQPTCPQKKAAILQEKKSSKVESKILHPPEGFSLRRGSSAALCQSEIDMATRVLIGCAEESANFPDCLGSSVDRASKLTGLNRKTLLNMRTQLIKGEKPEAVESARGNYPRGEMHRDLLTKINDTIDKLHAVGIMSSCRKIATALNFHHGILIRRRLLSSILNKMGYMYTTPGPMQVLLAKESESMERYRLEYLRKIKELRKDHEIVYLDESYVNQNHHQKKCWLKSGSQVYIPAGKGPRYILYGAGSKNGWLGKPTVFKNKNSDDDYHSGMNSPRFEELFQETCVLGKEQLGKCAFVMDNASYHKRLNDERCRLSYWNGKKAADVKEAWAQGEIPGQENYVGEPPKHKKTIIAWLRQHIPESETKVTVIAQEQGHTVLLLPPYRPELNAIETAWGVAKNHVASINSPQVRFSGLLDIIEQGLRKATVKTWIDLDAKVKEEEKLQLNNLEVEERRRQNFRDAHPDLIFRLDTDDDSDSEDDQAGEGVEDILAAMSDDEVGAADGDIGCGLNGLELCTGDGDKGGNGDSNRDGVVNESRARDGNKSDGMNNFELGGGDGGATMDGNRGGAGEDAGHPDDVESQQNGSMGEPHNLFNEREAVAAQVLLSLDKVTLFEE